MKKVFQSVDIPVFTMIRPHSFSFVYDETDFEIIEEDVRSVLELGGTRIVFGALHEDGTINEEMLQRVFDISPNIEMTFHRAFDRDRKSTRLNSSHVAISYAVFCLKKKNKYNDAIEMLYEI